MSAPFSAAAHRPAAAPAWAWPVDTVCYDRRPDLSSAERDALTQLGMNVRRRRGYDRDAPQWRVIARLLRPLDDARAAMWCPDSRYYQRAITDAIGLILLRCAEDGTSYWGWSAQDWARLIGSGAREFERSWPGWVDGTIRPYITAYAYLLAEFTSFQMLGHMDKLPLAWRVFGKDTVDNVVARVSDTLRTWGYRVGTPYCPAAPSHVCLQPIFGRMPGRRPLSMAPAVATHFRHCDVLTLNSSAAQVLPNGFARSRSRPRRAACWPSPGRPARSQPEHRKAREAGGQPYPDPRQAVTG